MDGEWITDHTAPQENDPANNLNNVLLPENITKSQSPSHNPFSAMMSGVGPQSTTTGLAGKVPKESARDSSSPGSSHLPGSFPETPATEPSEFSVNPIPASSGAGNPIQLKPGEKVPDPSTFNSNTVSSTARDDSSLINDEKKDGQQEQSFGVAPIPASSGIGNPVQLKPGENVPDPSTFNRNTVNSTVRTDKESYESSSGAPQLPNVVTPQKEREAQGGMFSLPASMRNMIPESSLPMGMGASSELDSGPTIQSVGPQSTTANLAADVPKESRGVPQIVEKSQGEAGFEPEAANNASAVKGKSETEKELESKIPEEPASAEGTSTEDGGVTDKKELTGGEIAGMAAGGAGAGSAVAAAAGYMSQGKSPEDNASLPSRGIPQSVQQSINEMNKATPIAPTVPDTVQESIAKSHQSPEAAASKDMVKEKSAMEEQLKQYVTKEEGFGESAPTASGPVTGSAIAATVPGVVQESITESHQSPEAAGSETMVAEKAAVEAQLMKIATPEESVGQPAPTVSAALSETAPAPTMKNEGAGRATAADGIASTPKTENTGLAAPATAPAMTPATKQAASRDFDSRDVSPMSRMPGQTSSSQPMVTSGIDSTTAPQTSQAPPTPQKDTPKSAAVPSKASPISTKTTESSASTSEPTDKKSKRRSIFGKMKHAFKH